MRWDHELRDDAYFSLTPYIRHTEMNFLMHFLPGTPLEENEHDSVGLLAAYYKDLEGGHKIIVGTDFEYTEGSLSEVQNDPNTYTFGEYVPGVYYDYDADATVIAPYIHTEWQVAENTRITAGARYKHTRHEYGNKTADELTGTKIYRPADRDDTYNNFSSKLGLVQSLTEDTSAFINLARGNRAPQTTDLYPQRKELNNVLQANSETIDSLEIGIRKVGAGIQYEVSLFYMKKKDYFFRTTADDNAPDGKKSIMVLN
jgi:iron complex outermembrane receptor protein